MSLRRAEPLTQSLLNNTVLEQWFRPMDKALNKVRYSEAIFRALPMKSFALLGGLRQLQCITTLREQVQSLFHYDPTQPRAPVARSTWSDAMNSHTRQETLRQAVGHLVALARPQLTDKLANVQGLGQRPVLAIDATYQEESSHYRRVLPEEGGTDNQKGHMLLTYYEIRAGIPVAVTTQTASMGEMRVLKEAGVAEPDWSQVSQAIYVVDRAFIDGRYWDERHRKCQATVITRRKSTLIYTPADTREVAALPCNEQVISDTSITLQCSRGRWRLIKWRSPEGIVYEYLTNDFSLEPGVVAFLYHRRWDEEKYFDNFKHDLANAKAWGKGVVAIDQQALLGQMTYILTRLFLRDRFKALGLSEGDQTQRSKHEKKVACYLDARDADASKATCGDSEVSPEAILRYDAYRAYYAQLSKITRQVWRFLKNCFREKSSLSLYQRQLKPLLEGYL